MTWRLKKGVTWHDGKPFTADDVVFTWEYVTDPATAALTIGSYREISKVETLRQSHREGVLRQAPVVLGRRVLRHAAA